MTGRPRPISGRLRAELARDPAVGAGNWLHAVLLQDRNLDEPLLFLDAPWSPAQGHPVRSFSLSQLGAEVTRLAAAYHQVGIRPRDPVGVYHPVAVEYLVHQLALTSIGAIPVLVNRRLPTPVAIAFMQRVGVTGVICDEPALPAFRSTGQPESRTWAGAADVLRLSSAPPDETLPMRFPYRHHDCDPVLITHSSGTTGFPKAVPMQHGNFFSALRYRLGLPVPGSLQRVLCALPPSHNSAMAQLMFSLICGLPIRMMSSQEAPAVLTAIEEFRPTMVSGFSTTFAALSEHQLEKRDIGSVTLWWNSGDAAHERHIRILQQHGSHQDVRATGRRLIRGSAFTDALGSSEMGHSLFNHLRKPGERHVPRCLGKPLEFVEAAVLNTAGDQLGPGEVGMLGIKSPTLTTGYWNDSNLTVRSRLAGYWLTGDLVRRDAEGRFYHLDRLSDVIATPDGPLYSLQAEELILSRFPQVADCTIVGRMQEDGCEQAYAYLQPSSSARGGLVDGSAITVQINAVLQGEGLPSISSAIWEELANLPVGPTGKVKKGELRARIPAAPGSAEHSAASDGEPR